MLINEKREFLENHFSFFSDSGMVCGGSNNQCTAYTSLSSYCFIKAFPAGSHRTLLESLCFYLFTGNHFLFDFSYAGLFSRPFRRRFKSLFCFSGFSSGPCKINTGNSPYSSRSFLVYFRSSSCLCCSLNGPSNHNYREC